MEVDGVKERRKSIREVDINKDTSPQSCQVVVHPTVHRSIYSNPSPHNSHAYPKPSSQHHNRSIEARNHKGNICGRSSAFLGIFTHSADGYGLVGA